MTNTQDKKVNWLAIISILLTLLLLTQTGAFIYFLNKKDPEAGSDRFPFHAQKKLSAPTSTSHPSPFSNRLSRYKQPPTYAQDSSDPFETMQEDMARLMGSFMSGLPSMMSSMNQHLGIDSLPLVDMEEKDNNYIVRVDTPGLDKSKIEISVRGEILTIQGVRETVNEEKSGSYFTQERSYGSFSRSLRLPGPVDDTNVKANYENGVLTITLPKISAEQASKKISVA